MSGICSSIQNYYNNNFSHVESNGSISSQQLSTVKKILIISIVIFLVCSSSSHALTYWNVPQCYQWIISPIWMGSLGGILWSANWINKHLDLLRSR